jgi:hypothetical protein
MKTLIVCAMMLVGSSVYAGDCGVACKSRTVTVTKEVVRSVARPFKRKCNDCCVGGSCRSRTVTVVR